jgi:hypothetical protein
MKAHSAASILVLAVCLLGCAGSGMSDVDAKKQDKQMANDTAKAFDSIDDAKCRGFGYQPGSLAYTQCLSDYEKLRKQGYPE